MSMRRYPKLAPEQEHAVREVANVQRAADGSYFWRAASRTELDVAVTAALAADCEVSIFVDGLDAETLAVCAREICDLAIDQGVTVRFRHRDRVLCLAEDRSDLPTAEEPG